MKNLIKRICILLLGFQSLVIAQTIDLNSLRIAEKQAARLQNTTRDVSNVNKSETSIALDSPINSDKYLVGPGDQLRLNIISSNETFDYSLIISPNGTLLIPSVGIIDCNGLTLSKLIDKIKTTVKNWNNNIKINVELEKIRKFRVLVSGQFNNAGFFNSTPVTRVSDLFKVVEKGYKSPLASSKKKQVNRSYSESLGMQSILAVDDFYSRKLGTDIEFESDFPKLSKRNIQIIRNRDTLHVDIEKFKVNGDVKYNPYVHQKDIIKIPYETEYFYVSGGAQKPGKYEFKEGESVLDAIQISGGFQSGVDLNKIKITRSFFNKPSMSFFVDIKNIETIPIIVNDHIMIPYLSISEPHEMVKIDGRIKHPGEYPIEPGVTTVYDIIRNAGGFLSDSDSTKFIINNRTISSAPDRELERILLKDQLNRSVEEQAYVKARIRTQKGSLEMAINPSSKMDHLLTNNDEIIIAKSFPYVEVIGAVPFPGRYSFEDKLTANDYINLAGGLSKNSSGRKFLVKSISGQRIKLNNKYDLESGDVIFIPEKIEYNDEFFLFKELTKSISEIALAVYYFGYFLIND